MLTSGPQDADILILGEAPGAEEIAQGIPFCGLSGQLLDGMLAKAGINRHTCLCTNVTSSRPPGNDIEHFFRGKKDALGGMVDGRYPGPEIQEGLAALKVLVERVRPKFTLAVGGTALWAATGEHGIEKWRGSIIQGKWGWVLPTIHPAAILRNPEDRYIVETDLGRAKRFMAGEIKPLNRRILLRPTIAAIKEWFQDCPSTIVCDIETRLNQIACIGFAKSATEAICIPILCLGETGSFWLPDEELTVIKYLREVFARKTVIFHNGLFDTQYIAKQWGFLPAAIEDTMIMQAVAFAGEKKSLAFISSMYADFYCYWKDDGKLWNPKTTSEEQLWRYNGDDCCYTFECFLALQDILTKFNLTAQYEFEKSLFFPVLRMMFRGISVNLPEKTRLYKTLTASMDEITKWLSFILDQEFNPRSTVQMKQLFYEDFHCTPIFHRKTKQLSLDEDALYLIKRRHPLLRRLIENILQYRSLSVFRNTFVNAQVSDDGRFRSSFNIVGAETFRFSSSQDVEGSGLNLQNIPKGKED